MTKTDFFFHSPGLLISAVIYKFPFYGRSDSKPRRISWIQFKFMLATTSAITAPLLSKRNGRWCNFKGTADGRWTPVKGLAGVCVGGGLKGAGYFCIFWIYPPSQ